MQKDVLQPEGFEPQLKRVFSTGELISGLNHYLRASRGGSVGDTIRRIAKTTREREKYFDFVGASEDLRREGLRLEDIEGFQVWSTVDPNIDQYIPLMPDKGPVNQKAPFLPGPQQKGLLAVFRDDVRDIPEVAERWFDLPSPPQLMLEHILDSGKVEKVFIKGSSEGFKPQEMGTEISAEGRNYVEALRDRVEKEVRKGKYTQAIGDVNQRLRTASERFAGRDLSEVRARLHETEAMIQTQLFFEGPFNRLPFGNRLRSLGFLALASNLMRADVSHGYVTEKRGFEVSESFGEAHLVILQRVAMKKVFGEEAEAVYSTGSPVGKYSDPVYNEVIEIQRGIVSRLQGLL